MKFGKTIKKIVALGTGATLMGATLMGAMAAADLKDYPSPFVKDGKFTGSFVIGDKAAAEDVVGVTDIAVSLQFASKQKAGTATTDINVEGDAWKVETSTKHLELSEKNKETLRNITSYIGEDELNALAQGEVSNSKGTITYDQYLDLLAPGSAASSGYVQYLENDDDTTADFLYFKSGDEIGKYRLEFKTSFESDIDNSVGTATAGDIYLTDYEDVDINMFGKTYTITKARKNSGTGSGVELTLMGGAVKDTLLEGDTKTYTVNGKDYEVTLEFVDGTSAKFTVNGESTRMLKDGETDKLSDKTEVGVSEILYQSYAGGIHSATFYIGAQKLELKDANVADKASSTNVKVGDNTINYAYPIIEGSNTSSTFKIDRITVNMTAEDDFHIPAGKKLSENPELSEPEVLFTNQWDILYQGLSSEETEEIKIDTSGSSKYKLTFVDGSGNNVDLPFAKTPSGSTLGMKGDTSDEYFINSENLTIQKNDYFVLTDSSQKRGERKTYIYQYKGADQSTADDAVIKFKDLGSGETIEKSYSDATVLATLKVGGADYKIYKAGAVTSSDFKIHVDLDGSGALNRKNESYVPITTNHGMEINISNRSANRVAVVFRVPDNNVNSGAKDSTETLNPETYQVNITASSGKVAFNSITTDQTERTPDGESNVQYSYNSYGTFFKRDSPSSDPGTLTITQPKNQLYANVFYTSKGASVTTVASGVADSDPAVVNRIEVGATKLASEVAGQELTQNLIIVGGPCANTAAKVVMGNPADCAAGFEPGKGKIELYENGDFVAMVVAGYSAKDTRTAAAILANYKDYNLMGTKMVVTTATSTVTEAVEAPAEETVEETVEETAEETTEETTTE